MASQVPQAALGGAVTGFQAGAPLGPWGMGIGAGIGALSGIFQGQRANKLQKQYEQAEKNVITETPEQLAYLNRVRQQERAFRAATDPSSAFAAMQARGVGAQTQSNLLRAQGPGAVGNILRAQAGTNQAMGQIGANAADRANQMLNFQGQLIDNIAQRRIDRTRELRNQAMERSVAAQQNIANMFSGALAMLPTMTGNLGGMGGGAKAAPPVFDPLAQRPSGPQPYDVQLPMERMAPRMGTPPTPGTPLPASYGNLGMYNLPPGPRAF